MLFLASTTVPYTRPMRVSMPNLALVEKIRRFILLRHRVYRVTGILSSRPNWLSPSPNPQASVVSTSLWFQGGHTLLRERGRWEPNRTKVQTLWFSRYGIIPLRPQACFLPCHIIIRQNHCQALVILITNPFGSVNQRA